MAKDRSPDLRPASPPGAVRKGAALTPTPTPALSLSLTPALSLSLTPAPRRAARGAPPNRSSATVHAWKR